MKLTKTDRKLDNPKFGESRVFKSGGFFSTKKTINFLSNKRSREDSDDLWSKD